MKSAVSELTGIPVESLSVNQAERLAKLGAELKKLVVGQDEAVEAMERSLKRLYARIGSVRRPAGTFMFIGPTGVGKTHCAKMLAKVLLGSEERYLRLDMAAFNQEHTISTLLGSPPGYVGYGSGGTLVNYVRENPVSVIVFDELEKAHPKVQNVLLQAMDNAMIEDLAGNKASLSQSYIIATSNIGAMEAEKNQVGFVRDVNRKSDTMRREAKNNFPPELLARFDSIITFRELSTEDLERIAAMEIEKLVEAVNREHSGRSLAVSDKVARHVVEKSEEKHARSLLRVIRNDVEMAIADWLIEGGKKGILDVKKDEIVVRERRK